MKATKLGNQRIEVNGMRVAATLTQEEQHPSKPTMRLFTELGRRDVGVSAWSPATLAWHKLARRQRVVARDAGLAQAGTLKRVSET